MERRGEETPDRTAVQLAPVVSLAAPVCSDQRAVLLPCGPSICPSASSRGAYFLQAVTAASDVLSLSYFPSLPLNSLGLFDWQGIFHWDARHERRGVGARREGDVA